MADVVVAGGGVVGLSIAWELAQNGLSVELLEQGRAGQEASWAGAGMLPPGSLAGARTAEARLRAFSHSLWPDWTARVCWCHHDLVFHRAILLSSAEGD